MSPHRLREDVLDRLEEAKTHVIQSMMCVHEHGEYESNMADAMRALVEIELALGELRHDLKSDEPEDDGNGAIKGMVETLQSRRASK